MDGSSDIAGQGESDLLDRPWTEVLDVNVRVAGALHRLRCQTVREVAILSDRTLLAVPNFGRKSLRELRNAVADVVEDSRPAAMPTEGDDLPPAGPGSTVAPDPAESSLAVDVDDDAALDRPWPEVLFTTVRVENGLRRLGVNTLREVLALSDRFLLAQRAFGRTSLRDLKRAILEWKEGRTVSPDSDEGAGSAALPDEFPVSLQAVADRVRLAVPVRERGILSQYWEQGRTLESIGVELGVTRERVRQRLAVAERRAARLGAQITAFLQPLTARLQQAGDLVHVSEIPLLVGEGRVDDLPFLFRAAGLPDARIWREEFLTTLPAQDLAARVGAVRSALRRQQRDALDLHEVVPVVASAGGFHLGNDGLLALLTGVLGLGTEGRTVRLGTMLGPRDRLVAALAEAGRPMTLAEIAPFLGSETEGDRLHGPEHRVESLLSRCDDVWRIDSGTFVHGDFLPIPEERLTELADLCAERLEGRSETVSIRRLARELVASGEAGPELTSSLLSSVLSRHPALFVWRDRVVHADEQHDGNVLLGQRIREAMAQADGPLTVPEIVERVNEGRLDYAPVSVAMCLQRLEGVVVLGGGRFMGRTSLPASEAELADLLDQAVRLIPEDGSPVSTRALLRDLAVREWNRSLIRRLDADEDAEAILWGLLRGREGVVAGHGTLVARQANEGARALSAKVVADAVRELGVALPREVERFVGNRHAWRHGTSTVSSVLGRLVREGTLVKLPGNLYGPADADGDSLFEAMRRHHEVIVRAGLPPDVGASGLGVVARYFYHVGELDRSAGVIEHVLARGDLEPSDRDRFARLRKVVRALTEAPA